MTKKLPGYLGKKSELTHYAIRDKLTGKYFRYCKDSVTGDSWEWVTGLNKASINVVRSTTEYVICKFQIPDCEIIEAEEYESFKKGQMWYRVIKEWTLS